MPTKRDHTDELRSNFTEWNEAFLPSTTKPCVAPDGYSWVHAYAPSRSGVDPLIVGKWLIRLQCRFVDYCWERVRIATEDGTLGIAAKVSTDWHNHNDPAGAWGNVHVICIYTTDWHDQDDVLRVAGRLREIDAVRKSVLMYKADIETYAGMYAGNAAGDVAIYEAKAPYDQLIVRSEPLATAEDLLAQVRRQ